VWGRSRVTTDVLEVWRYGMACAQCAELPASQRAIQVADPGTRLVNGICVACGYTNQVPCSSGCVHPLKVAGGVCRTCGGNGQIPCDAGCNQGLAIKNGLCSTNQATTPENCSSIGQSCVPDSQQGIHCCQNPGAPELCVYEKCHACIPHGAEVPAGGTQICCDAKDGDQIVLDQASGRWVCGIPG
jgi:hypothetical protein